MPTTKTARCCRLWFHRGDLEARLLSFGALKVPLFCQWVVYLRSPLTAIDYFRVDFNLSAYLEEPLVLEKDVLQGIYATEDH